MKKGLRAFLFSFCIVLTFAMGSGCNPGPKHSETLSSADAPPELVSSHSLDSAIVPPPSAGVPAPSKTPEILPSLDLAKNPPKTLQDIAPLDAPAMPDLQAREAVLQAVELMNQGDIEGAAKRAADALPMVAGNSDLVERLAPVLIRSGKVDAGIVALEESWLTDNSNSEIALMLISACRLRARETNDNRTQREAITRAAEVVREMANLEMLQPLGRKGAKLFERVILEEAAVLAHQERAADAANALDSLFRAGYTKVASVADLSVWNPIRDSTEFEEVIQSARKRVRSQLQLSVREVMQQADSYPLDFALPDTDGRLHSAEQFRGKVLVVDFWGTWCGPCRRISPHLVRLQRENAADLQVVGIAYEKVVKDYWADVVRRYAREQGLNYPCLLGDMQTKTQASVTAFPTLLFVDRRGNVRLALRGLQSFENLDAAAHVLIDEPAS